MKPEDLPASHLGLFAKLNDKALEPLRDLLVASKMPPETADIVAREFAEITAEAVYELIDLGPHGAFWSELRKRSEIALPAVKSAKKAANDVRDTGGAAWLFYLEDASRQIGRRAPIEDEIVTLTRIEQALEMLLKENPPSKGRPRHSEGRHYFAKCAKLWWRETKRPLPCATSNKHEPSKLYACLTTLVLLMCDDDNFVRSAFSAAAYVHAAKQEKKTQK